MYVALLVGNGQSVATVENQSNAMVAEKEQLIQRFQLQKPVNGLAECPNLLMIMKGLEQYLCEWARIILLMGISSKGDQPIMLVFAISDYASSITALSVFFINAITFYPNGISIQTKIDKLLWEVQEVVII